MPGRCLFRLTSIDKVEHDLACDCSWNSWCGSSTMNCGTDGTTKRSMTRSARRSSFAGPSVSRQLVYRSGAAYRNSVRAGSADFHNEVITLVSGGQRAAARLRYTGTHTGQLLGLPATGQRFEYAGAASSSRRTSGSSVHGSSGISMHFADSFSNKNAHPGRGPAVGQRPRCRILKTSSVSSLSTGRWSPSRSAEVEIATP